MLKRAVLLAVLAVLAGAAPVGAQYVFTAPSFSDIDWCAWENIPEEEASKAYDRFEANLATMSQIIRDQKLLLDRLKSPGGMGDLSDLATAVAATKNIVVLEAAWYRQKRILDCLAERLEAYILAREKKPGEETGPGGTIRGKDLLERAKAGQSGLADIRGGLDGFRGFVDDAGGGTLFVDGVPHPLPDIRDTASGAGKTTLVETISSIPEEHYAPYWNPIDKRWIRVPVGRSDPIDERRYSQLELLIRHGTPAGREASPGDPIYLHSRLLERPLSTDQDDADAPGDVPSPLSVFIKGGIGGTWPANDTELTPFNQAIAREPGFAGRFGGGVMWPDVFGEVDLGVDLVGVYGGSINDQLLNLGGGAPLNTSGRTEYVGFLPFLSLEFPLFGDWSGFIGGGLGIGHQWMDLTVGGVSQAKASGTGLVGQVGGGIWVPITGCTDVGLETYYTFFDDIDGRTLGGTPFSLEGSRDISVMLSVRTEFSNLLGTPFKPILDTDAFATCP